jgi:TolB protein
MQKIRIILLVLILMISLPKTLLGGEVNLDISAAESKRIDIALPLFSSTLDNPDAVLSEIHQIFTKDLELSGRFNVVDISKFYPAGKTETVNPDFHAWYLVGIQDLITGHVVQTGDDLELNMRLFDVMMGQQIVGIRYKTPSTKVRTAINKFCDEIQFRLTGEKGINDTRITFTTNSTGNSEIYCIDPDGNDLFQVTRNKSINLSPTWSPDGTKIYFTSYKDSSPDIFIYNLEDNSVKPIAKKGMNITPCVSPDGKKLTFSKSFDGDPEIVIFDLERKTEKRITNTQGVDTGPTFSPNGQEIAFVSDRGGNPQIYIMDADGADIRRLSKVGDYNTSPDWSPRGDWIVYHSRREGTFDLWIIRPDGNDEHALTGEAGNNEDPSFARDGRHIAFISSRDGERSLYITDITGRSVNKVLTQHGTCSNPSWSR